MAEGYIGETTCSTYIRQRLHYVTSKTSTGHNVTVELQMRRTNSYGGATFQWPSNSYITINGDRTDWSWSSGNYPSIPAYNTDWLTFASKTVHVSHTDAATIGIAGGNYNMGGYLNGDTSGNISLEAIYTAPSGLAVSLTSRTYNSITAKVTLSSYGNPSGTDGRYIEAGICGSSNTEYGSPYRWATAKNTTSATITVNNSSGNNNYGTICGCQAFKVGAYASNTQKNARTLNSTVYYLPPAPLATLNVASQSGTKNGVTIKINIKGAAADNSSNASGAKVTTQYRYKIGSGSFTSWADAATNADPATNQVATVSGIDYAVSVTVEARQVYQGQYSEVKTLTFTTLSLAKLYVPVSGKSKFVNKLYVPVNGKSKLVKKLYISVNGKAKLVYRAP